MSGETTQTRAEAPAKSIRRGGRRPRRLAQSVILEEDSGPGPARGAVLAIGVAFVAFLAWAGFITIDDVMKTQGRVIPVGDAKIVRHPEGGRVSEILVKEGDVVQEGQILVRLDPKDAVDKLRKMRIARTGIGLLAEDLRALGSGREPDFSFALPEFKGMVEKELLVFASLKQTAEKRRRVLSGRISQTETKLGNIAEREQSLAKNADILEDELELREDLFKKGLTPKKVYLDTQRQVKQAHEDLSDLAVARKQATQVLAETRERLVMLETHLKEKTLDELAVVTTELDRINVALQTLEERVKRMNIPAPAKGIVKNVRIGGAGDTIPAGEVVLEIVPFNGETVVEARISPDDIDRVVVGQSVTVKIKDPAFARYGGIPGELKEISSATFEDENGNVYHKGTIALERSYVGNDPEVNRLLPGMNVKADVRTGSRTLLAYFLGMI